MKLMREELYQERGGKSSIEAVSDEAGSSVLFLEMFLYATL